MEAKHTPGPWFAKRSGFSTVYIEARLRAGVIQEVAACGPTEAGQDQQEANAEFIVRACNSHDQLVAALEILFRSYRRLVDSGDAGNWSLEDTDEGKGALAALAAAGAA